MRTLLIAIIAIAFACLGGFSACLALTSPFIGVPLFAVVLATSWDMGRFIADGFTTDIDESPAL